MANNDCTGRSARAQYPEDGICNEGRRIGALRCFDAMRQLESECEAGVPDDPRGFFMARYRAAEQIAKAIGPMSPEVEGAIMALAEYMHFGLTTGIANLEPGGWLPGVAMTEGEFEDHVREMEEYQAADIEFAGQE